MATSKKSGKGADERSKKASGQGSPKSKDKDKGKGKGKGKVKGEGKRSGKGKDKRSGKGRRQAEASVASRDLATVADAKLTGKARAKAAATKDAQREVAASAGVVTDSFATTLRPGEGFDLTALDPASTPGFAGDKAAGEEAMTGLQDRLSDLQERLYAESKEGGRRSVLLVIQGMDTSGKGGIMRHVVGAFDPQGVRLTSFKAPSPEERAHPFLWRIRNALPSPGQIGVFDRSHYEDVLIVRVHNLVPRQAWARRYSQINAFERSVAAAGTTIVKVMLHISSDEQKARLGERLERPDKHWKFNPGDLDERALWPDYMQAYQAAIEKCSTDTAPWFVVPADRKWYARLAVTNLVLEHLEAMDPQWPVADFDVEEQRARLAAMP